jgi:WD40 repeat protein
MHHIHYHQTNSRNRSLAFSPDSTQCLVTAKHEELWIVSTRTGERIQTLACPGPPQCAAWSPDGLWIAYSISGEETIRILASDAQSSQGCTLLQPHGAVEVFGFAPDGSGMSAGTTRGAVVVWDLSCLADDQSIKFTPGSTEARFAEIVHDGAVTDLSLDVDSQMLLSTSDHGTVVATRLPAGLEETIRIASTAFVVLKSPASDLLISGCKSGRIVEQTTAGHETRELIGEASAEVSQLCVSSDGSWVAAGWKDGRIAVIDRMSLQVEECGYLREDEEGTSLECNINDMAFSPNGRLLAACGDDAVLRVWSMDACGRPLWEYRPTSTTYTLCFVGNDAVALGGKFEEVLILNSTTGEMQDSLWGAARTRSLLFDVKYNRIVSGHEDGRIRLYSATNFDLVGIMDGNAGHILSLQTTPCADCYLSGGSRGHLKVWRADDLTFVGNLRRFRDGVKLTALDFVPKQQLLVIQNEDQVIETGEEQGWSLIGMR